MILRNVSSGGVTLESVSSNGGNTQGIVLDNAGTGGFTVTGLGSVAGSGGTINGKNGADGLLTAGNGVYINNTSNVSLSNMVISNTQNHGILGTNVTNFTLRDTSLTGTHGNNLAFNERRCGLPVSPARPCSKAMSSRAAGPRICASSTGAGSLDLTVQDSASDQAVFGLNHLGGDDSVHLETTGTASLTLLFDSVDVNGAFGDMLHTLALGSSSQDIIINDSNFINAHPSSAGGGVVIGGGGVGTDITVDYQVIDSTFVGAWGNALNAIFNQQAGDVRGYISGNTVGVNDGLSTDVGSFTGNGIAVGLDKAAGVGDASYTATIVDNGVYDVRQGSGGISVTANGGNGTNDSVTEVFLDGNVVAEQGDFALAAFYAAVGGGSGLDNSRLGLEISNNVLDNSGANFGANAVFIDQVDALALLYMPGYAGSPDGEGLGGTAGADISTFLVGEGNSMVNGAILLQPGFVYADFVNDMTGASFALPVWFP